MLINVFDVVVAKRFMILCTGVQALLEGFALENVSISNRCLACDCFGGRFRY